MQVARMTDIELLRTAYERAYRQSRDTSTRNAALLVNSRGIIVASAVNNFPTGVRENAERRGYPFHFDEHAERAVIYYAAKQGFQTHGLDLVCPWAACADCARAIIACGIRTLIRHDLPLQAIRTEWAESIAAGDLMLREAVVVVRDVKGVVGAKALFDGIEADI